jgi:hypothetical protein
MNGTARLRHAVCPHAIPGARYVADGTTWEIVERTDCQARPGSIGVCVIDIDGLIWDGEPGWVYMKAAAMWRALDTSILEGLAADQLTPEEISDIAKADGTWGEPIYGSEYRPQS